MRFLVAYINKRSFDREKTQRHNDTGVTIVILIQSGLADHQKVMILGNDIIRLAARNTGECLQIRRVSRIKYTNLA